MANKWAKMVNERKKSEDRAWKRHQRKERDLVKEKMPPMIKELMAFITSLHPTTLINEECNPWREDRFTFEHDDDSCRIYRLYTDGGEVFHDERVKIELDELGGYELHMNAGAFGNGHVFHCKSVKDVMQTIVENW